MTKQDNLFWGKDTGKKVVKASWDGAKMIGCVVIAGAALGLGVGAYNSASG